MVFQALHTLASAAAKKALAKEGVDGAGLVSLQDHLKDHFEETPTSNNTATKGRGYAQVIGTSTVSKEVQEACSIALSRVEGGGQSSDVTEYSDPPENLGTGPDFTENMGAPT